MPSATALSLEDKVGQLLCVPLTGDGSVQVEELRAGSIIIMDDEVRSVRQAAGLAGRIAAQARDSRPVPPWLHGFVIGWEWPGRATTVSQGDGSEALIPRRPLGWSFQWHSRVAAHATLADLEEASRIWGRRWRSVGLHVLPYPMLNVPTYPVGIMRETWMYGDADAIAAQGAAIVRGLERSRCGSMGSHFPVHGATPDDSHETIPVISMTEAEARDHLRPYAAAIAEGLRTICTAHVRWPAVDQDRIGTLSRKILVDLLRKELGFKGITMADAIGMEGFMQAGPMAENLIAAVNAGCDSICVSERSLSTQRLVRDVLLGAARDGRIPMARIDEAVDRHLTFIDWLGIVDAPVPTPESAEAVFQDMAETKFLASLETTARR